MRGLAADGAGGRNYLVPSAAVHTALWDVARSIAATSTGHHIEPSSAIIGSAGSTRRQRHPRSSPGISLRGERHLVGDVIHFHPDGFGIHAPRLRGRPA